MFLFYVNQLPLINFRTKISSVFSQSLLQLSRGQGPLGSKRYLSLKSKSQWCAFRIAWPIVMKLKLITEKNVDIGHTAWKPCRIRTNNYPDTSVFGLWWGNAQSEYGSIRVNICPYSVGFHAVTGCQIYNITKWETLVEQITEV